MTVSSDTTTDSDTDAEQTEDVETGPAATDSDDQEPLADANTDEAETDTATGELGDDPKADREAAKYRKQLRAAEAERDSLRITVEGYHRAEVERIASSRLIDGKDVWAGGVSLDSLLTDGGLVDPARVAEAVADIAASRPHWCKSAAAPASAVTSAGKPDTSSDQRTTTWSDVFTRARSGVVEDG